MKIVDKVLVASTIGVALTTAAFGHVVNSGPGTILLQFLIIGAALLFVKFVVPHHGLMLPAMLLLNMALFLLPAIPIYAVTRKRVPRLGSLLIVCWSILYVAMLFFLFPAPNEGP
jgi:hypothetical protein